MLKTWMGGTWVAQSVERPTLDFGSGHVLTVQGIKPHVRLCNDRAEPPWDFLSLPLSALPRLSVPVHTHSLSLKINKL